MNVFAKFVEIPSMILQDTCIKKTKRYGRTVGRSDGQRVNSIPSHKHSLRGGINKFLNPSNAKISYLQYLPLGVIKTYRK